MKNVILRTEIRKFHACWHAVITGQVDSTSVSHVGQVELIHAMLTRVGHVTVLECMFRVLRNNSL